MNNIFNHFLLMIQFFTRIPVNKNLPCEMEDFKKGAFFLPLVGLIIGIFEAIIYLIFKNILPIKIICIIIIGFSAMITGALHFDGLADTFDGFFSLRQKDKIIEIMKDSRIGSFGGIALMIDVILKIELLNSFLTKGYFFILLLTPMISRNAVLFLCLSKKTAKKNGCGNIFVGNMSKAIICMITIISFIISLKFISIKLITIGFMAVLLETYLFYLLCLNKIGGLTGDTLGANNELSQIVFMMVLIALLK